MPVTAKLFHDSAYRSVFKHDKLPTKAKTLPLPK
jgi:hypothetical protein